MSPNPHFAVGALVQVAAIFRDPATSNLMDPAVVSFEFKDPGGSVTAYVYGTNTELVKEAVGKYHVNINANAAGHWYWRFFSTGTGQAAEEGVFTIDPSNFS